MRQQLRSADAEKPTSGCSVRGRSGVEPIFLQAFGGEGRHYLRYDLCLGVDKPLASGQDAGMKRRYLYVLLFSVPIVLASALAAFAVFGAAAGLTWIYVAGDKVWPATVDKFLVALFGLVFITASLALIYRAYAFGKEQEILAPLNPRHAWSAVGATTLLIGSIAAYQWRIGNIGPPSDEVRCSDFCRDQGFAGSGMPPKDSGDTSCSCFDATGREHAKVPVEAIPLRR